MSRTISNFEHPPFQVGENRIHPVIPMTQRNDTGNEIVCPGKLVIKEVIDWSEHIQEKGHT
jgi:hypothetical protein